MKATFAIVCFLVSLTYAHAQKDRIPGKVIKNHGATYAVDNPDYKTNLEEEYKVVFDVSSAPEDPAVTNKWIGTIARFLNMHVQDGKSTETLHPVMVMHGNASYGLLKNEYYKEKFGVDNPNIDLIEALKNANVTIILCGQTAAHRDLTEERRLSDISVSLSAMTALIQLQNRGYQLINFN